MKTSTVVILGVVGLAAVGGFVYWQHTKTVKAAAARKPSGSTLDKAIGTISAAIPLVDKITSLWA